MTQFPDCLLFSLCLQSANRRIYPLCNLLFFYISRYTKDIEHLCKRSAYLLFCGTFIQYCVVNKLISPKNVQTKTNCFKWLPCWFIECEVHDEYCLCKRRSVTFKTVLSLPVSRCFTVIFVKSVHNQNSSL